MKKLTSFLAVILSAILLVYLASCGKASFPVHYDSESGSITWDSQEAVSSWNILVNGTKKVANTAKTAYTLEEEDVNEGQVVEIEVEGVDQNGKVVTEGSTEVAILPSLTISTIDGYYDWSVSDTEFETFKNDGYTVKYKAVFDGVELSQLLTESRYKVSSGSHEIRVKAVLEGNKNYFSNYSSYTTQVLAKPININFERNKISWTEVDFFGATAVYKAIINEKEFTANSNVIDIKDVFEDYKSITSLSVTIQAISTIEGIESSEVSDVFNFKQLQQVQNVRTSGASIVWDAVEGATGYEVEVDGVSQKVVHETSYTVGGNFSGTIRVRAVDEEAKSYSTYSQSVQINTIARPTPFFSDDQLVWNGITTAASYWLKVEKIDEEGKVLETIIDENIGNTLIVDTNKYCQAVGVYKVYVAACPIEGSNTYSQSEFSEPVEVVRLGSVMDFRITEVNPLKPDGQIIITLEGTRAGAIYECTIGDTIIGATNGNTFTIAKPLASYEHSTESGYTSLVVKIQAKAAVAKAANNKLYLDATDTFELELRQLDAPQNVHYEKINGRNYICWTESANGVGYGVLFSNAAKVSKTNQYEIPEIAAGNYTVSAFAIGDCLKDYSDDSFEMILDEDTASRYDKKFTYEDGTYLWVTSNYSSAINVTKLSTPTNITPDKANSVFKWDSVIDAKGYSVMAYASDTEGVAYTTEESEDGYYLSNQASLITTMNVVDGVAAKGVALTVTAKGNTDTTLKANERVILDSDSSKLDLSTVYHWLAAPTVTISDLSLNWNSVRNAGSYRVYDVLGKTTFKIVQGTYFEWTDLNGFEGGTYTVSIQALVAEEINYFDSCYGQSITFTKHNTPVLEHLPIDNQSYFIKLATGVVQYSVDVTGSNNYSATTQYIDVTEENTVEYNGVKYVRYTPDFHGNSNPVITVRALGGEVDGVIYMASNAYKLQQKVDTMAAPENPTILGKYSDGILHITSDAVNPFGLGYNFYFNNSTTAEPSKTAEINYNVGKSASLDIQLAYEGEIFFEESAGNYVYYYSSSKNTNPVHLTFLATPKLTESNQTNHKVSFKWNAVSNGQYQYSYVIVDTQTNEVVYTSDLIGNGTISNCEFEVADQYWSNYRYALTIKIYAVGNDKVDSEGGTIISAKDPLEETIKLR